MAKAAKMMDVVVAGRMAKMRITVREPAKKSEFSKVGEIITEAMQLSNEAEFNTRVRSKYRKA